MAAPPPDLPARLLSSARRGQVALLDDLARRDNAFLRAWRDAQDRPLGLRLMDDILATDTAAVRCASNLAILLGHRRYRWLCVGQDAAGRGIWPRLVLFDLHLHRSGGLVLAQDTMSRLVDAANAARILPDVNALGHGLWRQAATLLPPAPGIAFGRHLHEAFTTLLAARPATTWLGVDPEADCAWLAASLHQAMLAPPVRAFTPLLPGVTALLAVLVCALPAPPVDMPPSWRGLCLTAALHGLACEKSMAADIASRAEAWLTQDVRIAPDARTWFEQWLANPLPMSHLGQDGQAAISSLRAILARHDALVTASGIATALAAPPQPASGRRRA